MYRHIPEVYLILELIIKESRRVIVICLDDLSVLHFSDMIGVELSYIPFMRNKDDKPLLRDRFDYVHDLKGIGAVEVTCRLIRNDNAWVFYYRTRDSDPLPLASGKGSGELVSVLIYSDFLETVPYARSNGSVVTNADHAECNGNIFKHCSVIKQVEILEDIAYAGITYAVDFVR